MNLYWSISEQKLVKALTSTVEVSAMTFVLRDATPISVYLVEPQSVQGTPYAVTTITSGHHVEFGAKAAPTDTAYLIQQATWTSTGSGATQRYVGSFPLNGASLITAMTGLTSLSLYAEFTTVDGDGKNYLSTQFTIKIIPDVIKGTES